MFTLLHQLVKLIKVTPVIPTDVLETLDLCANQRDMIASDILKTSPAECKSMLTAVFNGEQPGDKWKGHAFTSKVRALGRYMRWLACSVLPHVYQERMENVDCNWPQASTLYYMWTALEDYILGKIVDFITASPVQHLSLHYDGVRVQYSEAIPNVTEMCKDIGLYVAKETGFVVQLREKTHSPLFAMIYKSWAVQNSAFVALPEILKKMGNASPRHCVH